MPKNKINSINNELKSYINEATGISNKCKMKLISLVQKHFYVDLPNDNFLNIDITILDNGNIIMRDDEYKTNKSIKDINELYERYALFKEDVEQLLNKNATDFDTKKKMNDISDLLMVLLIVAVSLVLVAFGIRQLLIGDIFGVIWLIFIITYYIVPITGNKIRNRFIKAKQFINKYFTKK